MTYSGKDLHQCLHRVRFDRDLPKHYAFDCRMLLYNQVFSAALCMVAFDYYFQMQTLLFNAQETDKVYFASSGILWGIGQRGFFLFIGML